MTGIAYSVVIPNLHSPKIGEVLEALLRQGGVQEPFEILVVGRDRHGLVRRYENEDPRVRFLESERDLTPAEARNRGIRQASGEGILFIDADCIADPHWMAALLKRHGEGHRVVGGSVWFERDSYWILCDNVAHFHDLLPDMGTGLNRRFTVGSGNMMAEKASLERAGMFDESFPAGEDFGLSRRLCRLGYALFFEPEARVLHKPSRDSLMAVLRHSAGWARDSIRIRTQFGKELRTPFFLYLPMMMTLRLISPGIAAAVTFRIFWKHPSLRRYWYTAPVVFLAKLVWCWTVAREVQRNGYRQGVMLQQ
jgi:glycosyltransferase involved in cell wall biosynthesis